MRRERSWVFGKARERGLRFEDVDDSYDCMNNVSTAENWIGHQTYEGAESTGAVLVFLRACASAGFHKFDFTRHRPMNSIHHRSREWEQERLQSATKNPEVWNSGNSIIKSFRKLS